MSRKTLESYVPKKHGSIDYDSKAEKNGKQKASEAPKNKGYQNLKNLKDRTPEERKRISRMGVETRARNKRRRMMLQDLLRELLEMKVSDKKQEEILKRYGFSTDTELSNASLLMVALFRKGLTGDVSAIREITAMMDKLDLFEAGKETNSQTVTINLVPVGEQYQPTEQDAEDIWKAENGIFDENEENEEWETDDWGEETYDG